jgi:hypothetical protein
MDATARRLFLILICLQALHSIEEYTFELWEVFPPARLVSGLVSENLAVGFAVVNAAIVAAGFWSYLWPIRRNLSYAVAVACFWALLEAANGIGHMMLALATQWYFPGVYTAPLLLVVSGLLATRMMHRAHPA